MSRTTASTGSSRAVGAMRVLRPVLLAFAVGAGVAACGDSDKLEVSDTAASTPGLLTSSDSATEPPSLEGDVVVFAAASLADSFVQIGDDFMAANPGVTVTFSTGGSSTLAQQIVSGAPADVFAAASPTTMAVVTDAGAGVGDPVVFVRNRLEIAVPAGNPGKVTGLTDFADPDLKIALCDADVPCGVAAAEAFAAAGVTPAPDTLEQDVTATLTKVTSGDADAALVYRTDVLAAGDAVEGLDFPEAEEAINDYPIELLADAPNPAAGQAFISYVLSEAGLQVLADAGFDID